MPRTPPKPRVIFGTNGVCSCHEGFFFFVYYRGGVVLGGAGRPGRLASSQWRDAPPLVPSARMRLCPPYTKSTGRTGNDAPTESGAPWAAHMYWRRGPMTLNAERGLRPQSGMLSRPAFTVCLSRESASEGGRDGHSVTVGVGNANVSCERLVDLCSISDSILSEIPLKPVIVVTSNCGVCDDDGWPRGRRRDVGFLVPN